MIPIDNQDSLQSINNTVYGLLATVSFIFIIILMMLEYAHRQQDRTSQLINRYHLVVSESSAKLLHHINQTRYQLLYFDHVKQLGKESLIEAIDYPGFKRDHMVALRYNVLSYQDTIRELMQLFPEKEFEKPLGRVLHKSHELLQSLDILVIQDNKVETQALEALLEPLAATADQVLQLHSNAYRKLLFSAEENIHQNQGSLLLMSFILTAMGLFGVIKMLRHVRSSLSQLTHTQQLLSQSEQRLQDAEHVSHMGYVDWDLKLGHTAWSNEIYYLHGFSKNTLPTMDALLNAVHPQDKSRVSDIIDALKQNLHKEGFEYRIVRDDDNVLYINAKAGVDLNEQQQVVRILLTLVDITEQKLIELELQKYRHHLEDLVDERTRKLEQAQRTLMRQHRLSTLGQLTATVSHELRNPLGAMRPALYILKQNIHSDDQKIQDAIARLDRNIIRCDNIIDELLDFTRIRALECTKVSLDRWLNALIDEQVFPVDLHIEKQFGLEQTFLELDNERLTRAVTNVLKNAVEAMEDNSKHNKPKLLRVETCRISKRFEIAISDNGKGIANDTMEQIFEPLFSTKTFGVGLGMPTVKHIMEQHGGGIEISTEQNKGTTIILWLPVSTLQQNLGETA